MVNDFFKALKSIKDLKIFLKKHCHLIAYLFFGVLTTAINFVSFWLLSSFMKLDTIPATISSWIIAVIFAFITNKLWVFESKKKSAKETTRELVAFLIARIITLVAEIIIMWLMVDILKQHKLLWKLLCNVITVVLNYLFSKFFVFSKNKKSHSTFLK